MKNTTFWNVTLFGPVEVHRRFRTTLCLQAASCLGYSSTLNTEAIRSSETSMNSYQRSISEDIRGLLFILGNGLRKVIFI
jgi:hypothetical protein